VLERVDLQIPFIGLKGIFRRQHTNSAGLAKAPLTTNQTFKTLPCSNDNMITHGRLVIALLALLVFITPMPAMAEYNSNYYALGATGYPMPPPVVIPNYYAAYQSSSSPYSYQYYGVYGPSSLFPVQYSYMFPQQSSYAYPYAQYPYVQYAYQPAQTYQQPQLQPMVVQPIMTTTYAYVMTVQKNDTIILQRSDLTRQLPTSIQSGRIYVPMDMSVVYY
jgi:hypothetical protein